MRLLQLDALAALLLPVLLEQRVVVLVEIAGNVVGDVERLRWVLGWWNGDGGW
jgi:hypothetical protein